MSETIVITTWLDREHVEQIRTMNPSVEVIYEPDLLIQPRFPGDHGAEMPNAPLSAEQEGRWLTLLKKATILFDIDRRYAERLPELAPNVRWIQSTSSGIGPSINQRRYPQRMPRTIITTASGVHAIPLAEFAAMSMLMHSRRGLHMMKEQASKRWERFSGTDLSERTALIIGLGSVGSEVARISKALRMRVLGIRRDPKLSSEDCTLESVSTIDSIHNLLPQVDFLILAAPQTMETQGLIGKRELHMLPKGAVLINISRGSLIDEPALIDALTSGHLGGAYLDVFSTEPLPESSPLWSLSNVLVNAHSASTSDRENSRIVDLFCINLKRFLNDKPLLNILDPEKGY
jgi:glyoxylate/hydroxypyruvate reductase A